MTNDEWLRDGGRAKQRFASEKRFVLALVARVVGLHFHQGARIRDIDLRPFAVGSFYLRAVEENTIGGSLFHLRHLAASCVTLKRSLHRCRQILPAHSDASWLFRVVLGKC